LVAIIVLEIIIIYSIAAGSQKLSKVRYVGVEVNIAGKISQVLNDLDILGQ
jgi:hypothetical protein